jgi:fructokinase
MFQGGSPSNVAVNFKKLGKNSEVVACVGDDGIGKFLIEKIKASGISGAYIQINKEQPTSVVMVARSKATPDFIAYRAADVQLRQPADALIGNSSIIHTTAFALSKQPAKDVIMNTLEKAKQSGKTISVDWNFSPAIWSEDDGKFVFEKIMQFQPLLKLSADDMHRFLGNDLSIEAAKTFLDKYSAEVICFTIGKNGVWYKSSDNIWKHKIAAPVKEIKDTTGAGDAFWAGLISAYIDQCPIDQCVENSLTIAAQKLQNKESL